MPTDKPALTPQTLDAFLQRIRSDNNLKFEAINSIRSKGLAGMAEEFFTLSDKQRQNLSANQMNNAFSQKIVADGVQAAFETNGKVALQRPGNEIMTGFSVDIDVGADGSVHVGFGCAL